MIKEEDFNIILSKNRIARTMKNLYLENGYKLHEIPGFVLFDFDEIEKKTGVANQPSGRDILTSKMNV